MGYRQFDFECLKCKTTHTDLVWKEHGAAPAKKAKLECPKCGKKTQHRMVVAKPAAYLYDRPYMPIVEGGSFDTTGNRRLPRVPELPNDASFDQARDMFASKSYKERMTERQAKAQENKVRRRRLEAHKKDPTIDMRTNPLPGDPSNG